MTKKVEKDEKCSQHEQPLIYYCTTCKKSICSDCAMFGNEHKDHKFEHLSNVYNQHLHRIKEEEKFIIKKLSEYSKLMDGLRKSIDEIQKSEHHNF